MSIVKKIALVAGLMTAFAAPSFSEERGVVDQPSPDATVCITLGSHTICIKLF